MKLNMALCRSKLECSASRILTLHRPRRCATRQGLTFVSLRSAAPLAHTHEKHSSKYRYLRSAARHLYAKNRQAFVLISLSPRRTQVDRSAKLQSVTCSAAPEISNETPAWGKDCDGMFATSEPDPTPDGSPPDTSWTRPVWDALKLATAAAIGVVARAVGGKGAI